MPTSIKFSHAVAHMKSAKIYSDLSHAKRLKVGCVIVKGDTPIALGWNGMPPGFPNQCEDLIDGQLVTKPECRHAEINALNKLRRSTERAEGAISFQTHSPCYQCAIDLVEAKIGGVVFESTYRNTEGIEYIANKGIPVFQWIPKLERFGAVLPRAETGIAVLVMALPGPLNFL